MTTIRTPRKFGWLPDLPDKRDYYYSPARHIRKTRPSAFDLRPNMPPVYNQENLGSCTANAIAGALEYLELKQGEPDFVPSRLFIYWNERRIEGTTDSDSGAMIRDGIKVVNSYGACREVPTWPYDTSKFAVTPPQAAYEEAKLHEALLYQRVAQTAEDIESRLYESYPVVIGISVYDSFLSAGVEQSGIVPMPGPFETVRGGHAVLVVGYNREQLSGSIFDSLFGWIRNRTGKGRFIVRNSWGENWGQKGYFTIPYDYVLDPTMASDFWTIEKIM